MRRLNLIHRSPYILGGSPVFRGTRVPVRTLLDYLEEGMSLDQFLKDFPTVTHKQAVQIIEILKRGLLKKRYESVA